MRRRPLFDTGQNSAPILKFFKNRNEKTAPIIANRYLYDVK